MARRRRGFQDLTQVNQILGQLIKILPTLEREVSEETEHDQVFGDLVASLHVLRMWLARIQVLTPQGLAAARLRFGGIVDIVYQTLKVPKVSALDPNLRVRLATLGKLLLSLSKFRG